MPNPWDIGSARILESLGFEALATTSSGLRGDARPARRAVTATKRSRTRPPFAGRVRRAGERRPRERVRRRARRGSPRPSHARSRPGSPGCSVEDYSRERALRAELAAERVAAAAEAAHAGDVHLVLTARAENHIRGNPDLADTIARLQSFQEAGADVLFAPGLSKLDDIRRVVAAVDLPLNVLARPNAPTVAELSRARA